MYLKGIMREGKKINVSCTCHSQSQFVTGVCEGRHVSSIVQILFYSRCHTKEACLAWLVPSKLSFGVTMTIIYRPVLPWQSSCNPLAVTSEKWQTYLTCVMRKQTLTPMMSVESNSEKLVSYQKKDGHSHMHPSFFWYDDDKDLKVCFLVTHVKWYEKNTIKTPLNTVKHLTNHLVTFWELFLSHNLAYTGLETSPHCSPSPTQKCGSKNRYDGGIAGSWQYACHKGPTSFPVV